MELKTDILSIFLISIFMAIFLVSATFIQSIEERILLIELSRGGYSDSAVHFSINHDSWGIYDLIQLLDGSDATDFMLILDDHDTDAAIVRHLYIKGSVNTPPMLSGRFFTEDDLGQDDLLAVVGRNNLDKLFERSGEQYISVANQDYSVLGVVGHELDTILDEMIIINLDTSVAVNKRGPFILDAKKPGEAETIFKEVALLAAASGSEASGPLNRLDINPPGVDRLVPQIISMATIYVFMILSFLLCSVTISYEWVSKQRKRISVKRLIGWSDSKLKRDLYRIFAGHAVVGIGLASFALLFIRSGFMSMTSMVIVVLLNIICGWLITIVPIRKMLSVSVAEILR
ncbi:MAG: ABC transporter permease [Firmicutes bacterium]|nr:ABC transporter permease [Bacillota bacterium]